MLEKVINAETNEVYHKLRASLIENKCKIIAEQPPKTISILQGSLWGTSPKGAQKKISYWLYSDAKATCVVGNSKLTPGYLNLTLSGVALSIGLMLLCIWIAFNLQAYSLTGVPGFWGWIANIHGRIDSEVASLLITVCWILTAFLAATLAVESVVVARIRSKIDFFAEEILKNL